MLHDSCGQQHTKEGAEFQHAAQIGTALACAAFGVLALVGCGSTAHLASGSQEGKAVAAVRPTTAEAALAVGHIAARRATAEAAPSGRPAVPGPIAAPPGARGPYRAKAELETRISGLPVTLAAGETVNFTALLENHSRTAYRDVAPLFTVAGGPCNCLNGTLQRFNSASGTWQAVPMPEGDGGNPLMSATGGVDLAPGASAVVHYRLAIASQNSPGPVIASLDAVLLPSRLPVGWTS